MKRVIYSLIALTLILSACGVREPNKMDELEPPTIVTVVPTVELSKLKFTYSLESFKGEVNKQEQYIKFVNHASSVEAIRKKSEIVVAKSEPKKEEKPKAKVKPKTLSMTTKAANEAVYVESQGKERTFTLTAYTAGYESTGKRKGDRDYGKTSSGTTVKEGRTMACPKEYKSGTKIYIPILKNTYTCEDTGGLIKGNKLDIYFEDIDVVNKFGKKKGVVGYVLSNS